MRRDDMDCEAQLLNEPYADEELWTEAEEAAWDETPDKLPTAHDNQSPASTQPI